MKHILFSLIIFILPFISYTQNFVDSDEFILTKNSDYSSLTWNKKVKEYSDEVSIYILDNKGNKLKELIVSAESYENDSKVEEFISPKFKKIRKIVRVIIRHCACYCNTSKYYWLISIDGRWIELPEIEQEDYEFEFKTKDYVFSGRYFFNYSDSRVIYCK